MIPDKQSLRITCRKVRAKIVNKEEQSQSIVSKLLSTPAIKTAGSILVYYPLEHEVDILPLIKELEKTPKKIYLPFFTELKVGLLNYPLNYVDKLHSYEPSQAVTNPSLDVIIIPALAYDKKGYRLGQGKGWYDRFLKSYPDSLKIGVCFEQQLLEEVPHNDHDQMVDLIITSHEVINCH